MSIFIPLLLLSFVFIPEEAVTQEKPAEPLRFEEYVIADSLDYSADNIEYYFDEHKVLLTGNAIVTYQGKKLTSYSITYWQDFDYVEAVGIQDSSGVLIHTPSFTDTNGEVLNGTMIKYNLKTGEGMVQRGVTKYERGFLSAGKIKRSSQDTLYVADGTYTTCDLKDNPHYFFSGKKMKLILDDKLIIKPIIFCIHDIPVIGFPFYVFPIKKGRQSGFLTPRYGSSRIDGRYLSNLGYYFALNDYTDYKCAGVIRERNGWLLKNWFNYNKRYSMSGSVYGSFDNRTRAGTSSKNWILSASHSQTVSPTLSISGRGEFQSTSQGSSYSQYNSHNLYDRLNRDMRSTLSIRKTWKESGNSLMTTFSFNKNLDTNNKTSSLPNISFRQSRKPLFGSPKSSEKLRKYTLGTEHSSGDEAWYESIYYTFDAKFNNSINDNNTTKQIFNRQSGFSTNISSSQKLMGWLVSEPSLSLSEDFAATNNVTSTERYKRTDNLSLGLQLGTTIYGMFTPSIGSCHALRHVMTPSISYSYGKQRFLTGEDFNTFYQFDKNENARGKISRMNLSFRNILQGKFITGEKERKVDLFTLNFSSSVDFEEKETPIAPLQTTLDIRPIKIATIRMTARHSFYDDNNSFHLINPYLDNVNITTNIGISQSTLGFMGRSSTDDANINLGNDDFDMNSSGYGSTSGMGIESSHTSVPFNLSFSHTYGINRTKRPGKDAYPVIHNIKPRLTFSPSKNLSINYFFYYDIEKKTMVSQNILISRDLHCWEANVSWVPSGIQEGFYVKVNIKELPDVKIEQRRGKSMISY